MNPSDDVIVEVPQNYIDALEISRKQIFDLFPNADITMTMRLQNITEPMFNLTHRRWPEVAHK